MKINKTLIIISLLFIFCISLSAVSATEDVSIDNNVATVESSVDVDEINVNSGEINKSSEIYNGIKNATGTYNILADYEIDQTWDINNSNVIIEGNNHTIYGNNNRAFYITGNNVTIQNLNFVNCSASDSGGAIYFKSEGGSVSGCSFVGSNAYDGGAIYGSSSVDNCSFIGCSASRGGAICFISDGSVSGCSFMNCNSTFYQGGAIYFDSYGSVSCCSFVNCSSTGQYGYGGAIYFRNDGSVNYCIFDNNKANEGSAIYISGGSVNVDYNFFAFKNNVNKFPNGLISGASPNNWVVLNISEVNNYYLVNFVLNDGSALNNFMPDYTALLNINGDIKEITIKNNTFNDTLVLGTYILNSPNTGNLLVGTYFGIDDSFTALNNLIINIENNTIILNHDYTFYSTTDNLFKEGILIDKNNLVIEGNGFTIDGSKLARVFNITGNNVTIKNINFINANNGGAIFFVGGSGSVVNCSFVGCSAAVGDGGAICFDGSVGNVSGCSFVGCFANGNGGAIFFGSGGSVVNCSFVNCSASRGEGGGAIFFGSDASGTVSGCSFVGCSVSDDGGAIFFGSGGSVVNCSFVNCSASRGNGGGAIFFGSGGSGTVSGCSFVGCSANRGGAILFKVSGGSVVNCSFVGCSASYNGGAIFLGREGSGTVSGCSFVNCSASRGEGGGAIFIDVHSDGSVVNCSFVGCSASNGGAIFIDVSSDGSVGNCSFVNCSANKGGGAIFFGRGGSVGNCSFVNCSANKGGGAIYFNRDKYSVNYCIFDNNKAKDGSAIYIEDVSSFDAKYNFFAFQNNITEFPSSLIRGPFLETWIVLDIVRSGDNYVVKFVDNWGNDLTNFMPDYTARLVIGSEEKIITIHNNQFSCEYDPTKSYKVYSLNSGKLLTSLPSNSGNGSDPDFKPKVILTVDDIKRISGSTVKVNVGVHDMLGTPINEGIVTISLNGKEYTAKVVNGVATLNIKLNPGEYTIVSSYGGDGKYSPSNVSVKVSFNGEGTDYDNTTCDFTVTSVEDNNTEDINKSVVSNTMENCGTPLIALLIALISLPIIRRRK